MGHPKKQRRRYQRPSHPWQRERILEEKGISKKYGLKNKKDIWKLNTLLSKYKRQAKKLSALDTKQSQTETKQLFNKLKSYGLITEESYDAVLSMNLSNIMERRLQTMLVTKKLARTVKQARQMITHNHVCINGKTIDSPSYLVKISEEHSINFNDGSNFKDEDHPERFVEKETAELEKEVQKTKPVKQNKENETLEEDLVEEPGEVES